MRISLFGMGWFSCMKLLSACRLGKRIVLFHCKQKDRIAAACLNGTDDEIICVNIRRKTGEPRCGRRIARHLREPKSWLQKCNYIFVSGSKKRKVCRFG